MKKNILLALFGICLIFLVSASLVSAGSTSFDFQAVAPAKSMTVSQGATFNLLVDASSNNNIPLSSEKIEAIRGANTYLIKSWNDPGTKYGSTYLFWKTYTMDASILIPGTYTLRFSAQTNTGLEYSELTLIVNTPPQVSIASPANGNTYANIQDRVRFTVSDINGNLDVCWATDGTTTTPKIPCTASGVTTIVGLSSSAGSNTWTVYAQDTLGDIGSSSTTFTISSDTIAPAITISAPANGNTYFSPVNSISFTPTDGQGNLQDCWYSLNGGITQTSPVTCNNGVVNSFSGFSSVTGTNNWVVYARDSFGNIGSTSVSFTYTPDTFAPTVTISTPVNGNYYNAPVTQIRYTPTDSQGNLISCSYSLDNGATQIGPLPCINGVVNLISAISSVEGINRWLIYAEDRAGNIGSTLVSFTQDTIAPVITALDPMNSDKVDDEDVILAVSTNEAVTISYSLDNAANITMTETSPGSLIFESATLNLDDTETYSVIYYATDLAGNTASLTINFKIEVNGDDGDSYDRDAFYDARFLDQYNPAKPAIDIADDTSKDLTWWQRFINWLCRLFGLEEIY